MTTTHKPGIGTHRAWPGGVALSIVLLGLAACAHSTPIQPAATGTAAEKIAPMLKSVAQQLAAGRLPSDFTTGQVRADSQGRLQVYVYISSLSPDDLAILAKQGLADAMPSPVLHLVQGWVKPQDLDGLAGLPFVTRITPPRYAQLR